MQRSVPNSLTTLPRRTVRRAFTLIEVLLVIVIIGMLATVLVVTIGGQQEGAAIDTTKVLVQKVAGGVTQYQLAMGRLPTEADGGLKALINRPADEEAGDKWRGPYATSSDLKDAWGADLNYEPLDAGAAVGGVKFKLWSNGPDQQANTEDDIKNWEDDAQS